MRAVCLLGLLGGIALIGMGACSSGHRAGSDLNPPDSGAGGGARDAAGDVVITLPDAGGSGSTCTGDACVETPVCGDGAVTGDETCDDSNTAPGDGCDATCRLERGWYCPVVGVACVAAECSDGIVAGFEQCDDGNTDNGDGCSVTCQLEDGFKCTTPGELCTPTTCGDGVVEGTEQCDDQNVDTGDGCSPFCKLEPVCTDGVCQAHCGDGLKLDSEDCDDGNNLDGDGCSADCTVELGFTCDVTTETPVLPIVYRDFIGTAATGSDQPYPGNTGPLHQDFERYNGCHEDIETTLDAAGKPALRNANGCVTSAATFAQWYRSDATINDTVLDKLTMLPVTGTPNAYEYFQTEFFPLDGRGFNDPNDLQELARDNTRGATHNFHFTSELRYWFTYRGGEKLTFYGDDDVWVFINGNLSVDIGGPHGRLERWIQLPSATVAGATGGDGGFGVYDPAVLGIEIGKIYDVVVYQAERHTTRSQYKLTLENFLNGRSSCQWTCGDGIVTRFEVCDDGVNDGSYGGCEPGCQKRAPFCGDRVVQTAEGERCDDGNHVNGDGCEADCRVSGIH
jgi:fibro-slime domain-containing protein